MSAIVASHKVWFRITRHYSKMRPHRIQA